MKDNENLWTDMEVHTVSTERLMWGSKSVHWGSRKGSLRKRDLRHVMLEG
jgi:hypothetical protein